MTKQRPDSLAGTSAGAAGDSKPLVDPLRALWALTAAALAIILAYCHAFPQAAYPLYGIAPSLGMILLAAASVLIVFRSPWLGPRALAPAVAPCALLLWALWRTAVARVPTEGTHLLGTLLEGCLVFGIALILAAVGKQWYSFRLNEPAPGAGRDGASSGAKPLPAGQSPLFADSLVTFLLLVVVGMSLWAIYEYFVRYDQQLLEFRRDLALRGQGLGDLSPSQWALLEALRAKRASSRFGNPNVLAGFLAMVAPLAVGAAVRWSERSSRAAALGILGLIWYVALLSGSRGGLLALVAATGGAAVIVGWGQWRKRAIVFSMIAAVCLGAAFLSVASGKLTSERAAIEAEALLPRTRFSLLERIKGAPIFAQRWYYLQSGWAMMRQAPLLGQGLGSYAILYPKHKQPLAREARYPHNILCHLWVEVGLLGLLLWLGWVTWVLARAALFARQTRNGPLAQVVKVFLWAAAVYLFNNLFEMTWVFRETYLDWCLIMGALAGLGVPFPPQTGRSAALAAPPTARSQAVAKALALLPPLLGIALANWLLLRPMVAESCRITATELLSYSRSPEARDEALTLLLKTVRFQPRNPWYHDYLGSFYGDNGRPDLARIEFDKALQLNPDSAMIRASWAKLEREAKQFDRARQLFGEATRFYPLNARYHAQLADLEQEAGNLEAALAHIDDALGLVLDAREKTQYQRFRDQLAGKMENPAASDKKEPPAPPKS